MKTIASMAILLSLSGTALAQQSVSSDRLGSWPTACNTIYGDGRQLCLVEQYQIRQEEKSREQQGSLQREQAENQRLQNELLRRELAQPASPQAGLLTSAADYASIPGFASWHAENRWFGSDRARTEYALLCAKELREEQPDLAGRPFLNALAARVNKIFAASKR